MADPSAVRASRWAPSALVLVGALLVGLAPLSDGDLWWHLAAGRELVRTHAWLAVDPFSSDAAGRPWTDVHWGFQLAAYAVHALGGLRALVLAKALLIATGAWVLLVAVNRGAGRRVGAVFAVAFLAALFAARGLLLMRPAIVTLVFMALFFHALERFRHEGRLVLLAPLPLLQLVWCNVQGLSMLGPGLVGAYALATAAWAAFGARGWFPFGAEAPSVDRAPRAAGALALTLGACLVACAATPYGLPAVVLPFELLHRLVPGAHNVYAANVVENVPPWVAERTAPGHFGHLAWFLGLCAVCLLVARRVRLSQVLVLAALIALALAANRNVLLLYWLGTPIAALSAGSAWARGWRAWRRRGPRGAVWLGRLALAGAAAALLVAEATAAAREPSFAEAAPWRAPVDATDVVARRPGSGTIFAADQYGGYLIWRLWPRFRPTMDTRLVLRSPAEFAAYLSLADEPTRFDAWERAHPVDYVLLPVGFPDRYLGLIAHLYASDKWALVFTDGADTLFARRRPEAPADAGWELGSRARVDAITARLDHRFAGNVRLREAALLQLATLELAVGQPEQADRLLMDLATPAGEALRARCRLALGDLSTAQRLAERSLARDAADVRSLDLLAVIAARQGDTSKAASFLGRALEENPFDGEARQILTSWEEHAKSP